MSEVTDEMIKAATDAWPHLDDSTDRALWGSVYRIMRDADPLAAAERAVLNAFEEWQRGNAADFDAYERLHIAYTKLLRLRAAAKGGEG